MRYATTLLFILLMAGSTATSAQIVSGSIVGATRDSSGAVIAGVKVMLVSMDTNQAREMLTNDSGAYHFATLPPGRYRLSTSRTGFKSAGAVGIELLIDQTARVDLTLEVGDVSEHVDVVASAVLLQTESPTLGQVIEEKPIADLPLNGRSFTQLAALSAGVVPATETSNPSGRLGRTQISVHIGGGRGSFNSVLIDGMENRGSRFGEISMLPSVDAIKEFKFSAISTPPNTDRMRVSSACQSSRARIRYTAQSTSSFATTISMRGSFLIRESRSSS